MIVGVGLWRKFLVSREVDARGTREGRRAGMARMATSGWRSAGWMTAAPVG
jgi:hypothetical protein